MDLFENENNETKICDGSFKMADHEKTTSVKVKNVTTGSVDRGVGDVGPVRENFE